MQKNQDKWENAFDEDSCSEIFHVYDNQRHDPMFAEKVILIQNCQAFVNTTSVRSPLNIAVIGQPGAGKSSFLNTVFASFNLDSWREIAPFGFFKQKGSQLHFTERFRSYTGKDYYRLSENTFLLMPTFVDMTGFPDEQSNHILDLLDMVFSGRIRENQKMADIAHLPSDALNIMNKRVTRRSIDRIIVVSTLDPDSHLPADLMCSIVKAARKNRDIPIYGVLTGRDKYDPIRNEKVKENITRFRGILGLPKHRFACITNYCEDSDKDMKYLNTTIPRFDVPVLRLMKQILTPVTIDNDNFHKHSVNHSLNRFFKIFVYALCFFFFVMLFSKK